MRRNLFEQKLDDIVYNVTRQVLREGFEDNGSIVREMMLYAWNTYDITREIEHIIMSMSRKNREELSVERLAQSSVMKNITRAVIKEIGVDSKGISNDVKREFRFTLAQEMIDRIDEYAR